MRRCVEEKDGTGNPYIAEMSSQLTCSGSDPGHGSSVVRNVRRGYDLCIMFG